MASFITNTFAKIPSMASGVAFATGLAMASIAKAEDPNIKAQSTTWSEQPGPVVSLPQEDIFQHVTPNLIAEKSIPGAMRFGGAVALLGLGVAAAYGIHKNNQLKNTQQLYEIEDAITNLQLELASISSWGDTTEKRITRFINSSKIERQIQDLICLDATQTSKAELFLSVARTNRFITGHSLNLDYHNLTKAEKIRLAEFTSYTDEDHLSDRINQDEILGRF